MRVGSQTTSPRPTDPIGLPTCGPESIALGTTLAALRDDELVDRSLPGSMFSVLR